MNCRELLESGELFAMECFEAYSRATVIYCAEDAEAVDLCRRVNSRWNQFVEYREVKRTDLPEELEKFANLSDENCFLGRNGIRGQYMLYVTGSQELTSLPECNLTGQQIRAIDCFHLSKYGREAVLKTDRRTWMRYEWILEQDWNNAHYAVIFLLLCEIYNQGGVQRLLEDIDKENARRGIFHINMAVYDAKAQKNARIIKNALSHAIGISMSTEEQENMVETAFKMQFQCREDIVEQIKLRCPRMKDLLISFSGYEELETAVESAKGKGEKEIPFSVLIDCLYGGGEDGLTRPEQLLGEAEPVIEESCNRYFERYFKEEIFHYPYRFLNKGAVRLIQSEQSIAENSLTGEQDNLLRIEQKLSFPVLESASKSIERAYEELSRRYEQYLSAQVRKKWWEMLGLFTRKKQRQHQPQLRELCDCYDSVKTYVIGAAGDGALLTEAELGRLNWSKPVKEYFTGIRDGDLCECSGKELHLFYSELNWNLQGGKNSYTGRDVHYLYVADTELEQEYRERYGREDEMNRWQFLNGVGKERSYLLQIWSQTQEDALG